MYLTQRFYLSAATGILLMACGYAWPPLYGVGWGLLVLVAAGLLADIALLWSRRGLTATRHCEDRLSNGDWNVVTLSLHATYPFAVRLEVVDETPAGMEVSPLSRADAHGQPLPASILLGGRHHDRSLQVCYRLRPHRRGVYGFGLLRLFATTRLGLVERRYSLSAPRRVKVYPSYLLLRAYELLAFSDHLTEMGIKRVRQPGHHTAFEQIRDYVAGDDFRTINWRATARRSQLMVNEYRQERSQQVFSVIDKGRVMQETFRGMTLLDYAINASLVLSYVTLNKQDKAGLITFDDRFDSFLPASRQSGQMQQILECLYGQHTTFGESDFSALAVHVAQRVGRRSLLVLYTNFACLSAMERQLPFLLQLSRRHCLLVVFFEDSEVKDYIARPSVTTEDYYRHVIAEKFAREKRLIATTLTRRGIYSLLTTPDRLSVDVINRYLEMKRGGLLN